MRVVMIHAVAESIPPVKLAFNDIFPEAEVVNLLDEGLLLDFVDHVTPKLRRRMSEMICYCAEHGADAIGLAPCLAQWPRCRACPRGPER